MNMFARFDENPAMTLWVIKETKRYGRTDARTDARTDGQRENSIPPTNKVCGGIITESCNGSNNQQRINNNRITALEQTAAYISGVLKLHFTGTKSSP